MSVILTEPFNTAIFMYTSRGMAEIAGVDNDGVSRRGRHIDEGLRRFHKVKSSSRVIAAQTAQDHLKAYCHVIRFIRMVGDPSIIFCV